MNEKRCLDMLVVRQTGSYGAFFCELPEGHWGSHRCGDPSEFAERTWSVEWNNDQRPKLLGVAL